MPTRASRDAEVRITALVVVVLLHAALIAWIATVRRTLPSVEREEKTGLVLLPARTPAPSQGPEPPVREPRILPAPIRPSAPLPITPPTSSITPGEPLKSPSVDWHEQAQAAAARQAEEMNRPGAGPRAAPSQPVIPTQPRPEFGWDHARTHRVEAIEGGGMLVWINDRCAVVITLLAMPVCKIGTIPARGDLFDHMGETTVGDWKER
jgi:hypothetical protein